MKSSLNNALKISLMSALVIAPVVASSSRAFADTIPTKGTNDSYVGAGVGTGVIKGGTGEDTKFGGNISARVALPKAPVSFRGQVLYNDQSSAIAPKVTLDLGVAKNTNFFVGGGYNFVQGDRKGNTPLGDKNAPVVTVGAERKFGDNVVLYGNADLGINAYKNSNSQAVSVQAGLGFKY